MLDTAALVGLERAGAERTDIRIPQVGTVRSIAVQALHWKVDVTPLEAPLCDLTGAGSNPVQGQRRTAAVKGALRGSEGNNCSILPFARYSLAVNTRLAAIVVNHLRENPAPGGPKEAEPGAAGVSYSVLSRQSSHFSTATLTHAMDLARPAPASQRAVEELQSQACLGGMRQPDLSVHFN